MMCLVVPAAQAADDDLRAGAPVTVTDGNVSHVSATWTGEHFLIAWREDVNIFAARVTRDGEILDPGGRLVASEYGWGLWVEPISGGLLFLWSGYGDRFRFVRVSADLDIVSETETLACMGDCFDGEPATSSDGTHAAIAWRELSGNVSEAYITIIGEEIVGPTRFTYGSGTLSISSLDLVTLGSRLVAVWTRPWGSAGGFVDPSSEVELFTVENDAMLLGPSATGFLLETPVIHGSFVELWWMTENATVSRRVDFEVDAHSFDPIQTVSDGRNVVMLLWTGDVLLLPDRSALPFPSPGGGIRISETVPVLASDGNGTLLAVSRESGLVVRPILRGDGVPDDRDNCFGWPNPEQADEDGNGIGDVCDNRDFDAWRDLDDRCPSQANPDHRDSDKDLVPDACDSSFDWDDDGLRNHEDNCPAFPNAAQINSDDDALGDECDRDDDGDSLRDDADNCPLVPNGEQHDGDHDRIGTACDDSLDGDDVVDTSDNCPLVYNEDQADADGDGKGDACDDSTNQFGVGLGHVEAAVDAVEDAVDAVEESVTCAVAPNARTRVSPLLALAWILLLAPLLFFWRRR